MTDEMRIDYLDIDKIKPYKRNAKKHPQEQIDQIKKSIEQFGNNDPIAVWGKDNVIVEGHGRYLALRQMGVTGEVPVIHLDHLSDEERRAYGLVHNKLTMNSGFDFDMLELEMGDLDPDLFDMADFGFFDDEEPIEHEIDNTYTQKINIPQYEPKGEKPDYSELLDHDKYDELIQEINASDVAEKDKEFLKQAASRHLAFNYSKIASFYAHSTPEVQRLMEHSALVIIDFDDAIKNGFVQLSKKIKEIVGVKDDEG